MHNLMHNLVANPPTKGANKKHPKFHNIGRPWNGPKKGSVCVLQASLNFKWWADTLLGTNISPPKGNLEDGCFFPFARDMSVLVEGSSLHKGTWSQAASLCGIATFPRSSTLGIVFPKIQRSYGETCKGCCFGVTPRKFNNCAPENVTIPNGCCWIFQKSPCSEEYVKLLGSNDPKILSETFKLFGGNSSKIEIKWCLRNPLMEFCLNRNRLKPSRTPRINEWQTSSTRKYST